MEEKSAQTSTDRRMNMTDKTLDYYNKNAQSFVSGTVSVKFTQIQDAVPVGIPDISWAKDIR